MRWLKRLLLVAGLIVLGTVGWEWVRRWRGPELPPLAGDPFTPPAEQTGPDLSDPARFDRFIAELAAKYQAMDDRFRALEHIETKRTLEHGRDGSEKVMHEARERVWYAGGMEHRVILSQQGRDQNPLKSSPKVGTESVQPITDEHVYPFTRRAGPKGYRYYFEGFEESSGTLVTRIRFEPLPPLEKKLRGYIWAEVATAEPVRFDGQVVRPPMFIDSVRIITEYGVIDSGQNQIRRLVYHGSGGIAFIRRHGRMEVLVSDYRVRPP